MKRIGLFVIAALVAIPAGLSASSPTAAQERECQTFTETGKTVCGWFLKYWREHGALAQQGFPVSIEASEVSPTDGKTYTVQYFERAVFEYHPENPPPHNVLLSLLGNFLYQQKYPSGAPNQQANNAAGSVVFPETGKRVGGKFLTYWRNNGQLAQQGLPISDEFDEVSATDGKRYRVQYFERAVFEIHPELPPDRDVLLSLLGNFRYSGVYAGGSPQPAAVPVPAAPASIPTTGAWAATAWVDNPTPAQRTAVRVFGKLTRGGQPYPGAVMNTTWNYSTTTTPCSGAKTGSDGVAGCSNDIGRPRLGFEVVIDVSFVVDGRVVATTRTSFTPR
jgi:hypothetical protein